MNYKNHVTYIWTVGDAFKIVLWTYGLGNQILFMQDVYYELAFS